MTLPSPYFLRLSHLYESDFGLYTEEEFRRLVDLEGKRALRSDAVPVLLLLNLADFEEGEEAERVLRKLAPVLFSSTREVDAKGWYEYRSTLGILITDAVPTHQSLCSMRGVVVDRLRANLARALHRVDLQRIRLSCQTVPFLPDGVGRSHPVPLALPQGSVDSAGPG